MAAQWNSRVFEILHKFRPETRDVERESAPYKHSKTLLEHPQENADPTFFRKCFANQEKSHANKEERQPQR